MGLRRWTEQLEQTLRTMPARSRWLLTAAIFLTFASLTLGGDLSAGSDGFWTRVIATSVFSGLVGIGYAAVGFGYRLLFPIVLAVTLLGPAALNRWTPTPREIRAHSTADVAVLDRNLRALNRIRMAMALMAYGTFIGLLRVEGRRSIAAHTEIRLAREIHSGLVPLVSGRSAGFEWYGVSRPSGDVGGDLVDVISALEGRWTACIADVSGHGVAAGVLMGMFKTALHSARRVTDDPAAVLTQVNEVLYPLKQSNMFVTVAVLAGGEGDGVDFALAGHPPLIHVEAASGEAQWVGESQIAVGFIDAARFNATTLRVSRGDLIVGVTDGLVEVFDSREQELGSGGLLRIVRDAARRDSLAAISNEVFAACARYGAQSDDQSLLIVRRTSA